MLEMFWNPRKAERRPWEMFFVGLLYGSLSLLIVKWVFSQDPVLSKYSGLMVVLFAVMFTMPFMYFAIRLEEEEDARMSGFFNVMKGHAKMLSAFMWLFLGFVVAFSFWSIVLQSPFEAQIKTYCVINRPSNFEGCVNEYLPQQGQAIRETGRITGGERFLEIFSNNVYVMIFTLIFSLVFGAGAIFILAWNASVIAAAVGIFTKYDLKMLPVGVARFMIHGIPEIAAYFVVAIAGGMIGIAAIRHKFRSEKFWKVLQDSVSLIIIAIIILVIAGLIEVYITPNLF
ncbi:stage II sporulation protein M [Candidatus Pacearchaeota archaeon]|nr:stage II sporulation protein M [Candidatus Pacearchaeota archaeon]